MKRSVFALFVHYSLVLMVAAFLFHSYCWAEDGESIHYGYAIFRDADGDFIKSDDSGVYIDCYAPADPANLPQEERVEIKLDWAFSG